jgi:hypothetical protein
MYCFADPTKKPGATPQPPQPQEASVASDPAPAHVQVVPAEVLMKPGETQKFTVRLFNAHGQLLQESPATFTLDGPGMIADDGSFKAPADAGHLATIVTAKVGELTGRARIRIVPPLPWQFDFEGAKDAPITWVGARYRHQIRPVEGSNVMVKITTIPKGTRSRCWFGPSDLSDYTIQADVKGLKQNDKIPDIGVIAQGYTLEMHGAAQKLFLNSWVPHDKRYFKLIDFAWEANKWYTIKLKASNENGKAMLRGKVWPKGEQEPSTWLIELEDPAPNVAGSPGLFGNATNAEIFIDNVTVTPN